MDDECTEPKSLSDAFWQGIQEQAMDVAYGAIDMASVGVLYVAKELVFALSGDVVAADTDDYGMTNDLEEGYDDELSMKSISKSSQQRRRHKHKKSKTKDPKRHRYDDFDYDDIDTRDEESERAYNVDDLIKKFNVSGVAPTPNWKQVSPRSNVRQAFGEQPSMVPGRKTGPAMASPSDVLPRTVVPTNVDPTFGNVMPKYDSVVVQPLRRDTPAERSMSPGKSQDIFRPRSISDDVIDDSDRFAYLVADDQIRVPPRPEVLFSPLVPFKQLHQANKALFDEATIDTRNGSDSQQMSARTHGTMETNTEDDTVCFTSSREKRNVPELVNIRSEIEDIQRMIVMLEHERVERQKLEESSPTWSSDRGPSESVNIHRKDPKRAADIRTLILRLARLSERHNELKKKNVSAVIEDPISTTQREPAAINFSPSDPNDPISVLFSQ